MKKTNRALTELESCVLGVVWHRGPCTAYTVRREFAISSSSHWSSSAGSIYPVLARLESLGLIEGEEATWGAGTKKHYRATDSGVATLKEWIGPPIEEWAAASTFDPIRTRTYFLGVLTPAGRRRFVAEAEKMTREELARVRSNVQSEDRWDQLASRGVICELEGRLRWLAIVTKELAG
ncbi:MAG TPA: PadR family transcriptional regulator [Thermoanaerobaculia bacterium]